LDIVACAQQEVVQVSLGIKVRYYLKNKAKKAEGLA
jgi:hypothetical protein